MNHISSHRKRAVLGRRVLALMMTVLVVLGGVTLGESVAQAASGTSGVSTDGGVVTLRNGVTVTATLTSGPQGTLSTAQGTHSTGFVGGVYSPAGVVEGHPVSRIVAAPATTTKNAAQNAGTVTFTFSRPVTNPRLHLYRMLGAIGNVTNLDVVASQFTVLSGQPQTPTLKRVSDLDGWLVDATSVRPGTTPVAYDSTNFCQVRSGYAGSSPGGCGTVELTGTVESVTMRVDTLRGSLGTGNAGVATSTTAYEFTVDEDLAGGNTDTPASYGSASHAITGLSVGESVTIDNVDVLSGVVPATQLVDENDAFESAPVLRTARNNILTIPVKGLLAGRTATTSVSIDGNMDGVFDANETFSTSGGNGNHEVVIPSSVIPKGGTTWLRVRTSENADQAVLATGYADSGEVEDWPVTINAVAPGAPKITSPESGALLMTALPTFAGTGEREGQTIEIRTSSGVVVCSVVVGADLNWSCTPVTALVEGEEVYTAYELDSNGLASEAGDAVALTIDSSAPEEAVVLPTNGKIVRGTVEPMATVEVRNADGDLVGTATANAEGGFLVSVSPAAGQGDVLSVIVKDSHGNTSPAVTATANLAVPTKPVVDPSNGTEFSGSGTPSDTITVTLPNGEKVTAVVDGSGAWKIPNVPGYTPTDGDTVTVVATNKEATDSVQVSVIVDAQKPGKPSVQPTNGMQVSGQAEPDSTVVVRDAEGNVLATVVSGSDGAYRVALSPIPADEVELFVSAKDAAGNVSEATSAVVNQAPVEAPRVKPSNGSELSGAGTEGETIAVVLPSGERLTTIVRPDGTWNIKVPSDELLENSDVLHVTATNPEGTVSPSTSVVIDTVTPDAPEVELSNGKVITGRLVVPGDSVLVRDENGDLIEGELVLNGDGTFTFTPEVALSANDVVTVEVRDPARNVSEAITVVFDTSAPETLTVSPTNGAVVRGTTEPFATVVVRDANGDTVAMVQADAAGNYSATLSPALPNDAVIRVVASDSVGNTTDPVMATVNAAIPAGPQINPTNGAVISGIGVSGETITVVLPDGTKLTTTVKPDLSWSIDVAAGQRAVNGETVIVTATNVEGTDSAPASIVIDAEKPVAPTVNPSNGTSLSGTAEPGTTVEAYNASGDLIGSVVAAPDGSYKMTFDPALTDGADITVTATDSANNTSDSAAVMVDGTSVPAPSVHPSDGNTVSGSGGKPGNTITVSLPDGTVLETQIDPEGNWAVVIAPRQTDGAVITIAETNPAGSVSEPSTVTVDTVAPIAGQPDVSNGSVISGGPLGAGETVSVVDGSGSPVPGTLEVDEDGRYVFTPKTPVTEGDTVRVIVTDAAGNSSLPVDVEIITAVPATPEVKPSNGKIISGGPLGERETVQVTDKNGDKIDGTLTIDENGMFTFVPKTPLVEGDTARVTVVGPSGVATKPIEVEIDATRPTTPVVEASNGTIISGGPVASGDRVDVIDGSGNPIPGTITIDGDGNFTFVPSKPLTEADKAQVVVTDAAGNASAPVTVPIDTVAPEAPVVKPSNGSVVRGTAEAHATVVIADGDGEVLGSARADADGNFELPFSPSIADATSLVVTVKDVAGNTSAATTVKVNASAVAAPFVYPTKGDVLSGTGIACNTITATLPDGSVLTVVVADDGTWSITVPAKVALKDGQTVAVTATNPEGTVSDETRVTVDRVAPKTPTVDASQGKLITGGVVSPGDTVTIVDADGNAIPGELTVDVDGRFTFVPTTPLKPGEKVYVTTTDAAGNASQTVEVVVGKLDNRVVDNPVNSGSGEAPEASDAGVNGSAGSADPAEVAAGVLAVTGGAGGLATGIVALLAFLIGLTLISVRKRRRETAQLS